MSLFEGIKRHAFRDDSDREERRRNALTHLNNANGILSGDYSANSGLAPPGVFGIGQSLVEYNGNIDKKELSATTRTSLDETTHSDESSADDSPELIQQFFSKGLSHDWMMAYGTAAYKKELGEDIQDALTQLQPFYSISHERQLPLSQLFVRSDGTVFSLVNGSTVEELETALAATNMYSGDDFVSPPGVNRWAIGHNGGWPALEYETVLARSSLPTLTIPYGLTEIVGAPVYSENIQHGILKALAVANEKLALIDQLWRHEPPGTDVSNNEQNMLRSSRGFRVAKRLRRAASNVRLVKHPKYRSASRPGLMPRARKTQVSSGFDDELNAVGSHAIYGGIATMKHAHQFYQVNSMVPNRKRLASAHRLRGWRSENRLEYFRPLLPLRPGPLKIREVPVPEIKPAAFPKQLPIVRRRPSVYSAGAGRILRATSPAPLWTTGVIQESRVVPRYYQQTGISRRVLDTGSIKKYIFQAAPRIRRTVVVMPPTAANPEEYTSRFGPDLLSPDQLLAIVSKLGIEESLVHPPKASSVQIEVLTS